MLRVIDCEVNRRAQQSTRTNSQEAIAACEEGCCSSRSGSIDQVASDYSTLGEGAALDFGRMRMNTPTDPMIVEERNRVIEMLNLGKSSVSNAHICCS